MNSLFLRFLLWLGGGFVIVVAALVLGLRLYQPDAFATQWIRLGRGAVLGLGRVAVDIHERERANGGARRLESLAGELGVEASLFDAAGRRLMGPRGFSAESVLAEVAARREGELVILGGPIAGVRLRGDEASYVFVARLPPRAGFWTRGFLVSVVVMGSVVAYVLARQLTSSIVHLRSVTASFARGDLAARVTNSGLLARRDEIGGLIRDFNDMASQIEKLMQAQRRLLADVSHELRSPLTRLRLGLGLMKQRTPADAHAPLARMERDIGRLDRLIGQILALSRLESLGPPALEPIDLSTLVQEIADDADFEARSAERRVRILECAPCSVMGACDLLRSAVENAVRNAVHYTEPGTDVLMRLSADCDAGAAAIVVEDHGPGVPAKELVHLFEPFYRLEEARARDPDGVGLGLAITSRVVTLHGGSVSAANRPGGGLSLQITLPLADAGVSSALT
jgi:two-component system, OmpR family, sensor histidine kinase CpxA